MLKLTTNNCDRPLCNRLPVSFEMVIVGQAGVTNFRDGNFDFDLLFELDRPPIIASCVDAGKADLPTLNLANDA